MFMMPTYDKRGSAKPRKAKADAAPLLPNPTRDRILAGIHRIVRMQLSAMTRDWERCGKAACKRAHRCRGVACDAMYEE